MKLTAGQLLILLAGTIAILQKENILDASGSFLSPSAQTIARAGVDIEQLLKAHGLVIDVRIERIIGLIPLILALAGGK